MTDIKVMQFRQPTVADLDGIDLECVRLCDALNRLPGIETIESCCGHGVRNWLVAFIAETVESLNPLAECLYDEDERYPRGQWWVEADWVNVGNRVIFLLRGLAGMDGDALALRLSSTANQALAQPCPADCIEGIAVDYGIGPDEACGECKGSGHAQTPCPKCDGIGAPWNNSASVPCPECGGSGHAQPQEKP